MRIHREPNAELVGSKIIVVFDRIRKGPDLLATAGRHRAQYMIVEGEDNPALAVIDVKLHYIPER